MNMSDDIGRYIAGGLLLLFAILIWRAWEIRQASPQWPHVDGIIMKARVFQPHGVGGHEQVPGHDWMTEVQYQYQVNGATYTGNRIRAFGVRHFTEESAQTELKPFPAGATVPVYYDPANPKSSVLIPG